MTYPVYRRVLAVVGALALGVGGALIAATPAVAATQSVTSLADTSTPGTLRYALENLTPGGPNTINIVVTGDITVGATDLPIITEPVTITGSGEASLKIVSPTYGLRIDAPDIDVRISDLTVEGAPSADCGIESFDANVTLERVTVTGFDCTGVSVDGGTLVATDVTVNDNGVGLSYYGYDATDTVTLTRIVANDNDLQGVYVALFDSVATITSVNTTNGLFGLLFGSSNSTATISDVHADGAQGYGVNIIVTDSSVVSISDVSVGALAPALTSPGVGMQLQANDGARLIATRMTATDNEGGGIGIDADDGTVELTASLSQNNGVPGGCGCGGSGIFINTFLGSPTDSQITITGTRVIDNFGDQGAGIYVGTSQGANSRLTIADSVISGNEAFDTGGGIYVEDLGVGAVTGPFSLVRTTVAGNTAQSGGGVVVNGFSHADGGEPVVLIDSSTISGNTATDAAGGGYANKYVDSGAPGIVRIVNATISGNEAPTDVAGFGTYGDGGVSSGQMVTQIRHSTIAGNLVSTGLLVAGNQTVEVSHALLADNAASDMESSLTDPLDLSIEYSLVETPGATVTVPAAPGNIVGVDPALGPLANNGGPTLTHLIEPGSAAYNAGNPAITGAPALEQRGLARIYQTIDIGAVEWHPALAVTGSEPEPEPALVGLLMLFTGLALIAASRRFAL